MAQKQFPVLVLYESRKGRTQYDGALEVLLSIEAGRKVKTKRSGRWLLPSEANALYAIQITLDELGVPYSVLDIVSMSFRQKLAAKLKPIPRLEVKGKILSFSFRRTPSYEEIEKFYQSSIE